MNIRYPIYEGVYRILTNSRQIHLKKQKRHKVMYITSYLWRFRFSHFPVLDSARFGNMHLIWQLESFCPRDFYVSCAL